MKRATLLCVIVAIGIVCFDHRAAWARGFGESRGRRRRRSAGGGGGGFSHVPTASRAGGGYRAPGTSARASRSIPRRPITPARPPIMRAMSSRIGPPTPPVPAWPRRSSVERRPEGVGRAGPDAETSISMSTTSSTIIGTAGTATAGTAAGITATGTGTGTTIGTPAGPTGGPIPGTPARRFGA